MTSIIVVFTIISTSNYIVPTSFFVKKEELPQTHLVDVRHLLVTDMQAKFLLTDVRHLLGTGL